MCVCSVCVCVRNGQERAGSTVSCDPLCLLGALHLVTAPLEPQSRGRRGIPFVPVVPYVSFVPVDSIQAGAARSSRGSVCSVCCRSQAHHWQGIGRVRRRTPGSL